MKKNIFYNFLLTGSNLLFPLITFPYLSRILGAEGLGLYSFVQSYAQNFIIISALGIPLYGIREIAKVGDDKEKRSTLFFELLGIHLIFTLFLIVLYVLTVAYFNEFANYKALVLLGGSMILFNVFSFEWLFSGLSNFKYITLRTLIIRGLAVIAVFVFIKDSNDVFLYMMITVSTLFFTALLDVNAARKFIMRRNISLRGMFSHAKPVGILGVYMILTSVYWILPTTLIGFLSTKSAVGYYVSANKIIRVVISFFAALAFVMIPRLSSAVAKPDNSEYLLLLNKTIRVVMSIGIPITFFVFLFARPMVMLLAGKDFMEAVVLTRIMSPIIVLVAFAQIFTLLILGVNRKDKELVILSMIGMLLSIGINLVFIPRYAQLAGAVSQLVAELFVTVVAFFFARKVLAFHFPMKSFLLNGLCAVPLLLIAYGCNFLFNNDLLILGSAALMSGGYFLMYQRYVIKDPMLLELIASNLLIFKNLLKK